MVIVLISVLPIAREFFKHRKERIAEMNAAVEVAPGSVD